MFDVTENASGHLAQMLRQADAPKRIAIRLLIEDEPGITLIMDTVSADDVTFEYEEKIVLVLDDDITDLLDDKKLDVVDSGQGPKLALV